VLNPSLFAPARLAAAAGGAILPAAASGRRKSIENEYRKPHKLERCCAWCEESVAEDLKRCKLQQEIWTSDQHPLGVLYQRVEGLAVRISKSIQDFAAAIESLEVTCSASRVPLPSELGPAVASVLDVQSALLVSFRLLEQGFCGVLAWEQWTLVTLLGEGSAVLSPMDATGSDSNTSSVTDGGPRDARGEGLFTWRDRVCVYKPLENGMCRVTAAEDLDTIKPGQVLYEGKMVTSVAEHKILVNNLRRFYTAFWQGAYISHYKALLHRAQAAVGAAEVHAQASSPSLPPFLRSNSLPGPPNPNKRPPLPATVPSPHSPALASTTEMSSMPALDPPSPSSHELQPVVHASSEPGASAAAVRAELNSSSLGSVLGMVLRCLQVSEQAPTAVEVPTSTPHLLRTLSVRLKHGEVGPGHR